MLELFLIAPRPTVLLWPVHAKTFSSDLINMYCYTIILALTIRLYFIRIINYSASKSRIRTTPQSEIVLILR